MTFKLFVDEEGFIDDAEMREELAGGEVLQVWERFIEAKQVWLVMVGYQPEMTRRPRRASRSSSDARRPRHTRSYVKAAGQLDPHEQRCYEHLRLWRNALAQSRQVGPHLLLTNQQLIEVIKRRPESLSALGEVRGIGPGKLKNKPLTPYKVKSRRAEPQRQPCPAWGQLEQRQREELPRREPQQQPPHEPEQQQRRARRQPSLQYLSRSARTL